MVLNFSNVLDILKAVSEINLGIEAAKDILRSSTRLKSFNKNAVMARKLGFDFDEFSDMEEFNRLSKDPVVFINNNPRAHFIGAFKFNQANPEKDVISINLAAPNVKSVAMHEALHRGGYGVARTSPNHLTLGTNDFYQWKTNKLLADAPPIGGEEYYKYLSKPTEAAVHTLLLGRHMELPLGAKYPGNRAFKELIAYYILKGSYKKGLLPYLNWNKPRRIWDALTGQYFSIPLGLGVGYETLKNQTEE